MRRDRAGFAAYLAIVVPEAQWRTRTGAADMLSKQDTWRRFSDRDADRSAYQSVTAFPQTELYLNCREFRDWYSRRLPNCEAIRNGLALEAQGGRFSLRKGSATTGMAIFMRRQPQAPGQPVVTRSDLAGHEERIVGFSRDRCSRRPRARRALISLKEYQLHW